MLRHLAATCLTLAPHAIFKYSKKNRFRFGQVKYNTIYAFEEKTYSGIRNRQVPVWRGLISIVLSVINSEPNISYGIDRIPVWTGSGVYRLHCSSSYFIQNTGESWEYVEGVGTHTLFAQLL